MNNINDPLASHRTARRKMNGAFMAKDVVGEKTEESLTSPTKFAHLRSNKGKSNEVIFSLDAKRGQGSTVGLSANATTKTLFGGKSSASDVSTEDPLAILKAKSASGDVLNIFEEDAAAYAPTTSLRTTRIGTADVADHEDDRVGDLLVGKIMRKEQVSESDREVFGQSAAKMRQQAVIDQQLKLANDALLVTGTEGGALSDPEQGLSEIDNAIEKVSLNVPDVPTHMPIAQPVRKKVEVRAQDLKNMDLDAFDMDDYIAENTVDSGDLF